jgi:Alpha-kinase family
LKAANDLLELDRHEECALALFFLSDGEPSDARQHGWTPHHAKSEICAAITDLATTYGEHLTMSFVGFGNSYADFSTLQAMVGACNDAPGGAKAEFQYCNKMAHSVGTSLTSLATSLTMTRTSLMGRGSSLGLKRTVDLEKETGGIGKWRFFRIMNHWVYSPKGGRLVNLPTEPPGALRDDHLDSLEKNTTPPPFLAMNTSSCGYGAERIAFRCFLAGRMDTSSFTLGAMVAKETNLVNKMSENVDFHKAFCETQSLASFLAEEFNKRIRAAPSYNPSTTPIITFLPCSILVLEDYSVSEGIRGVLVEKMLDTKVFGWCKWNDNGGGVDGRAYHAPLDIDYEYKSLGKPSTGMNALVGVIEEGSEDEDSEDESEDEEIPMKSGIPDSGDHRFHSSVAPETYLQAFSHFTHAFTNKKVLVCDLQGVFNTSTVPPRFELTDPAIHYRSNNGRRMVYGRTDKGVSGMRLFFDTHKCTDVCKLVNLSKKNKDWRQAWSNEYEGKSSQSGKA